MRVEGHLIFNGLTQRLNAATAIQQHETGHHGAQASRLGTFFKTSAEFWNLQMTYDLRNTEKALPAKVERVSKTTGTCWHDTQDRSLCHARWVIPHHHC